MNKRLLITSTDLMMVQFLIPHVIHLSQNGFDVEIACSDVGDRMDEVREKCKALRKPRSMSLHTALVYEGEIAPSIEADGFFDAIIPFSRLLWN